MEFRDYISLTALLVALYAAYVGTYSLWLTRKKLNIDEEEAQRNEPNISLRTTGLIGGEENYLGIVVSHDGRRPIIITNFGFIADNGLMVSFVPGRLNTLPVELSEHHPTEVFRVKMGAIKPEHQKQLGKPPTKMYVSDALGNTYTADLDEISQQLLWQAPD